ncbi:hypothetical protein M8C21_017385, partial [Ambrosia artemisiifolia]
MEDKSMQGQSPIRHMNAYEKSRMLNILENQKRLHALGVKNTAKSLKSLVEHDKTKKNKKKPIDMSEKDVGVEQDYLKEAATNISQKKRVIAPNVSPVLTSSKSHMQKGQVIDTMRAINSSVPESDEGHTRGRSIVSKRKLFAVDNNDDHGELDMRFHEQDDAEDDGNKDMDGQPIGD